MNETLIYKVADMSDEEVKTNIVIEQFFRYEPEVEQFSEVKFGPIRVPKKGRVPLEDIKNSCLWSIMELHIQERTFYDGIQKGLIIKEIKKEILKVESLKEIYEANDEMDEFNETLSMKKDIEKLIEKGLVLNKSLMWAIFKAIKYYRIKEEWERKGLSIEDMRRVYESIDDIAALKKRAANMWK